MRYSSQVKPISYLKANAAEVLTQLTEGGAAGHHPERGGQGGHSGRRLLRRNAGNAGAAENSCAGQCGRSKRARSSP